jgi:hypothetical protein
VCRDLKDRIVTLSWNNDESPAQLVGDERVFIVMLMKVEEKEEVAA